MVLTTELMTKMCHRKEFQSFFFVSIKIFFLDASSVSPSSERMKELWVVCVFTCRKWSYASGGNMRRKHE